MTKKSAERILMQMGRVLVGLFFSLRMSILSRCVGRYVEQILSSQAIAVTMYGTDRPSCKQNYLLRISLAW